VSDRSDRSLEKRKREDQRNFGSFFENLRLIVRLLKDPRVNFFLKLLPIGALIYLFVPVDFLPFNPIEDALVLWLGGTLFIELCPDDIVQEHRQALQQHAGGSENIKSTAPDVVDGEFKDLPPEDH
jgi:hypothetical protein